MLPSTIVIACFFLFIHHHTTTPFLEDFTSVGGVRDRPRCRLFWTNVAQKPNSGEEYDPDELFELEFVHVQAGPQGSAVPKNKRPGYESSANFCLNKMGVVNISRDDAGLCAVRPIVTACGLHLAGSNKTKRDKWTRKCQRRRNEAAIPSGSHGSPGTGDFGSRTQSS